MVCFFSPLFLGPRQETNDHRHQSRGQDLPVEPAKLSVPRHPYSSWSCDDLLESPQRTKPIVFAGGLESLDIDITLPDCVFAITARKAFLV